jgi:hypothetical protein
MSNRRARGRIGVKTSGVRVHHGTVCTRRATRRHGVAHARRVAPERTKGAKMARSTTSRSDPQLRASPIHSVHLAPLVRSDETSAQHDERLRKVRTRNVRMLCELACTAPCPMKSHPEARVRSNLGRAADTHTGTMTRYATVGDSRTTPANRTRQQCGLAFGTGLGAVRDERSNSASAL